MQQLPKFRLSSEQCEWLAAFEATGSLAELAKAMHRDTSVVSRNLQTLGDHGVLEKRNNRWTITPLGHQMINWTRQAARAQSKIFEQQQNNLSPTSHWPLLERPSALVLIGVQEGFQSPSWGHRNNPNAEENIQSLLRDWRAAHKTVIHVPHHSLEPQSPLKKGSAGTAFLPWAKPLDNERIIEKSGNSAFFKTDLESHLRKEKVETLLFVGFSTNHCIDATVKAGAELGFYCCVISDGCVSFERVDHLGQNIKPDQIHQTVMANLNQEFAAILDTATLHALIKDKD